MPAVVHLSENPAPRQTLGQVTSTASMAAMNMACPCRKEAICGKPRTYSFEVSGSQAFRTSLAPQIPGATTMPPQEQSAHKSVNRNIARKSPLQIQSVPSIKMNETATNNGEGMPYGFGGLLNPFENLSTISLAQGQQRLQPSMQTKNAARGTQPHKDNSTQFSVVLSQRASPHQSIHSSIRPAGEPSRALSRVETCPELRRQSVAEMFSHDLRMHTATDQASSQTSVPRISVPGIPSTVQSNPQLSAIGPDKVAGIYKGFPNQLPGASHRPVESPRPPAARPSTAWNTAVVGKSTTLQNDGTMTAMFSGSPKALSNAFSGNGFQDTTLSPAMHHIMPIHANSVLQCDIFPDMHTSPFQQHMATCDIYGQPFEGHMVTQHNGLGAQIPVSSDPQTALETMNTVPQSCFNTGNQLMDVQGSPISDRRRMEGNPDSGRYGNANTGQFGSLINMALAPQLSRSQHQIQMQHNVAQNGDGQTASQYPGLQRLSHAFDPTPAQNIIIQKHLEEKIPVNVRELYRWCLLRLKPGNGDAHTTQQYEFAVQHVQHLQKQNRARVKQVLDKETQGSGQTSALQQAENQHQTANTGSIFHAKMVPNIPKASAADTSQLQPHGFQEYPTSRPTKPSKIAHQQQPCPATSYNQAANSITAPSMGQYTGIACTACHEIWANQWCDDNEPCENCADRGTTCHRPSCESGHAPKTQCTKTGRCNRAHLEMNDNWTLAPWRKDLKRKGKQIDEREWPAKRKRLEGENGSEGA
jgi:hypothetical protein